MNDKRWQRVNLGALCTSLVNGGTPDTNTSRFWVGTIPWVTGADFTNQSLATPRRRITEEAVQRSATHVVKAGNILLVTRTGVGKLAIAPFDIAISQDITGVYFTEYVDVRFMYYCLQSHLEAFKRLNQGTSINGILKEDFLAYNIELPPLPEQRKVARILTTLDSQIEKTEALIAKYQAIKQGMMQDLFTRGVDDQGHLRPTQADAPRLYKKSDLGWIPKEWSFSTLENAAERVIVGLALSVTGSYREKGIPLIRNQNIRRGFLEDDDMLYLDPGFAALFPNKALLRGDVLTVRTGANVGDTALLPETYVGCLTFTTLITTPKKNVLYSPYMVNYLASAFGLSELNRLLVGGGKENLNVGEFVKLRIPLPDVNEQRACIDATASVTAKIESERIALQKLRATRVGLMQDLLTGTVPVKVDKAEEVAADG